MPLYSSYTQKTKGLGLRFHVSESHLEFSNASPDTKKTHVSKGLFVLRGVTIL
jgi:hypothetical protein